MQAKFQFACHCAWDSLLCDFKIPYAPPSFLFFLFYEDKQWK